MAEQRHSRSSTVIGDHDPNHDVEKLPESMQGDRTAADSNPEKRRKSSKWGDQSQDDPFGDEAEGDVKYKTLAWWYARHFRRSRQPRY